MSFSSSKPPDSGGLTPGENQPPVSGMVRNLCFLRHCSVWREKSFIQGSPTSSALDRHEWKKRKKKKVPTPEGTILFLLLLMERMQGRGD